MINTLFTKKSRFLGVATGKRRYDLPLDNNAGNKFIRLLIALMTILLTFSLAGAFALSGIADKWSSGLAGKASIEIPAKDKNGALLSPEAIQEQTDQIRAYLENIKSIETINVLSAEEIVALVEPWLGAHVNTQNTPLPGIISLSFHKETDIADLNIETAIQKIAPQARLDTHKSWLSDILNLTGALRFAAYLIVMVIALTTIIAIAGAVRTRLSTYKEELELLHLIGADDRYIAKQFERHTLLLTLQGSVIGLAIGLILIFFIGFFLSAQELNLLPELSLNHTQIALMLLMPFLVAALSVLTARLTVLRTLAQML